jgi:hypothetical protein
MAAKIVLSKKFRGVGITVRLEKDGIDVSIPLNDFVSSLTIDAHEALATIYAESGGSPALLVTNSQLKDKIIKSADTGLVFAAMLKSAESIVADMKDATVAAK